MQITEDVMDFCPIMYMHYAYTYYVYTYYVYTYNVYV